MSNTKDNNQQVTDNIRKKGTTNPITRRRIVIGGSALAAGLTTVGMVKPDRVSLQQPQENNSNEKSATLKLEGKVAVITGGARGMGRAHAVTLAREGANIVICDLAANIKSVPYSLGTNDDMKETARLVEATGRRCLTMKADVRNIGQMRKVIERGISEFGKVDILVANAGVLSYAPLEKMTDEQWQDMIDVDLTGTANAMRAVIPHMVGRKYGRIVVIASDIGRRGGANVAHYCAAKWGVIGLVKSAALELAKSGITVNAISPGLTRTGMSQNPATYQAFRSDLANPTTEDVIATLTKMNAENGEIPIPWLEPEDIANGVLYLVSDMGRYVTGAALDITAGKNANYTA